MTAFDHFIAQEFLTVEGWISYPAAAIFDALLSFQSEHEIKGHVMEIGAFKGKTACLLGRHVSGEGDRLFILDSDLWTSFEDMRKVVEKVNPATIFIHEKSSSLPTIVTEHKLMRSVRFIHLDADHSFAETYNDLVNCAEMLSEDGIIAVDDFFNFQHVQVTAAVYAFLERHPHKLVINLVGYNKVYLCRPSAYIRYRTFILQELNAALVARKVEEIDLCLSSYYPADSLAIGIGPRSEGSDGVCLPDWENDYRMSRLA